MSGTRPTPAQVAATRTEIAVAAGSSSRYPVAYGMAAGLIKAAAAALEAGDPDSAARHLSAGLAVVSAMEAPATATAPAAAARKAAA